jgi:hypothetical protein
MGPPDLAYSVLNGPAAGAYPFKRFILTVVDGPTMQVTEFISSSDIAYLLMEKFSIKGNVIETETGSFCSNGVSRKL